MWEAVVYCCKFVFCFVSKCCGTNTVFKQLEYHAQLGWKCRLNLLKCQKYLLRPSFVIASSLWKRNVTRGRCVKITVLSNSCKPFCRPTGLLLFTQKTLKASVWLLRLPEIVQHAKTSEVICSLLYVCFLTWCRTFIHIKNFCSLSGKFCDNALIC
jgi:hypothetical protein